MKLNLLQIPQEGLEIKQDADFDLGSGETVHAALDLYVTKVDDEVFIKGAVDTSQEAVCGRCLKSFKLEQSLPFEVAFCRERAKAADVEGDEKPVVDEDGLSTIFYRGDEIDLGEVIKEQILLNAPMRPLCLEECKGLCPICGADMNIEACGCPPQSGDQRMQALKDYFNKKRKD